MIRRVGLAVAAAAILVLTGADDGRAQQGGPFAPRLYVNDTAITNYEFEQRVRFLRLLGNPPRIEKVALDGLIDDRLRMDEAKRLGVSVSEEALQEGMEEFAARGDLDIDQFVAVIGEAGVSKESFRDFVKAGLAWREVVRSKYGPRTQVTDAEIDRAVQSAAGGSGGTAGTQVLLSEIVLRADTPDYRRDALALARQLSGSINSADAFAAAARKYSVSRSRDQGGRMGWMPLSKLPPSIAGQVLALGPGKVSEPVEMDNAIVLFQLRSVREGKAQGQKAIAVDYAIFTIPGGTLAEAMKVRMRADTCDDLYGVARGLPPERLLRETRPVADLPPDLAQELAKLDENEVSYGLSSPAAASVLMLCGRTPDLADRGGIDREAVRRQLFGQRLAGFADSYLAELKADAIIREP
ncbi:peptidylprolyl isomerase [Rhodovulum sp. YEN HP10]|uniref:peptidylprolyl isomerase n=1 Tax=Rhodovulum sp. HP10 TaxID=3387397 RepID=UPI0039E1FA1B